MLAHIASLRGAEASSIHHLHHCTGRNLPPDLPGIYYGALADSHRCGAELKSTPPGRVEEDGKRSQMLLILDLSTLKAVCAESKTIG